MLDALRERQPDAKEVDVAGCWLELIGPVSFHAEGRAVAVSVVRVRYDGGDWCEERFDGREVYDAFGEFVEAACARRGRRDARRRSEARTCASARMQGRRCPS